MFHLRQPPFGGFFDDMLAFILSFAKEDIYFIDAYLRDVVVFSLSRARRYSKLIRFYPLNYDPSSFVLTYPKSSIYRCNDNLCVEFSNSEVFTSLQLDSTNIYIFKPSQVDDNILSALRVERDDEDIMIFRVLLSILPDTSKPKIKYAYSYVSLSFVFPYGFEIFNYVSDVDGKWRMVKNVVNFYALNVQKLNVYIAFKVYYDTLTRELYRLSASNSADQIKCIEPYKMKDEIDFDLGSAEIRDEYKHVLEKVYYDIDWKNIKELMIIGYADTLPIRGELAKKYPSNWELSSARALSVVKYLISLGAPADKLRPSYTGEHMKSQRKVEFYIVR